ncbi:MAG TPA: hypothetical protein VGH73_24365 [Thermoanaerobaculia bacterium]|jgi:hypothetical protein
MNGFLQMDSRRCLEAALAACRRAGEIHREHFRSAALKVELKADASPVTASGRTAGDGLERRGVVREWEAGRDVAGDDGILVLFAEGDGWHAPSDTG